MIKNTIMENTLGRNYRLLKKVDDFYRAEIKLNRYCIGSKESGQN